MRTPSKPLVAPHIHTTILAIGQAKSRTQQRGLLLLTNSTSEIVRKKNRAVERVYVRGVGQFPRIRNPWRFERRFLCGRNVLGVQQRSFAFWQMQMVGCETVNIII